MSLKDAVTYETKEKLVTRVKAANRGRKEGREGGAGEQLDAVGIFLPTLVGSPGENVESQGGRTCEEGAWLLDYVTSLAVNISRLTLL